MNAFRRPPRLESLRLYATAASVVAAVIGATVAAGWLFDFPSLTRFHSAFASMQFQTAICMLFSGAALWLLRSSPPKPVATRLAHLLALVPTAIALVKVAEQYLGLETGLSTWADRISGGPMPPATAVIFLCIGLGLLLMDTRLGSRRLVEFLPLLAFTITLLSIIGHGYQITQGVSPTIAAHSLLGFLLLTTAMIVIRPHHRLMALLLSETTGGVIARRLLPASLALPLCLGGLILLGLRDDLYSNGFAVVLYALANVLTFAVLTWWNANYLLENDEKRRAVEAALQQSNQMLETLVNAAPLAIVTLDGEGRVLRWNPAAENIFGWSVAEVLNQPAPIVPPQERAEFTALIHDEMNGARRSALELRRLRKDGTEVDVELWTAPLHDAQGRIVQTIGILANITGRKRSEENQRRLQHEREQLISRLQTILGEMPIGCILNDRDFRFSYWNRAAERIFGFKAAEVQGKHPFGVITPPEAQPQVQQLFSRLQNGEGVVAGLGKNVTKDGRVVICEWHNVALRDEAGGFSGMLSMCQDVTERRLSEEALRQSELRYRSLVAVTTSVVWSADSQGEFATPQPSWEAFTGQKWDQQAGWGWIGAIHPDSRPAFEAGWRQALESRSIFRAEGQVWHAPTKRHRYFFARAIAIPGADGNVREWIGTLTDIEDLKRAEAEVRSLNAELEQRVAVRTAQLEAANKELEAFSYSVSHDLRAPLRAIDGFSQTLQEDCADALDESGKRYLDRVRSATRRMGQLIDDLLELSRVTRSELIRTTVDLSQLAGLVVRDLQIINTERAVQLNIKSGLVVQGDPRLLRVVLENLLNNAWKFTRKVDHPQIEFGSVAIDGETAFYVRDNGAGFDMAYAGKLFGAFQRLHSVNEYEGTGIGLATVQRIIHRHNGRVWADAKPNDGATFYFTLPQ